MEPFPVVLFTYNRPEHTRFTVESLRRNRLAAESDLCIFSDGAKHDGHAASVQAVRAYLRTIHGFKTIRIVERNKNLGLAASVIAGVSEILSRHGAAIVVEDDMLSAPSFLEFMNAALHTYQGRGDVFSVTGYNYPLPIPPAYAEDAYLSYRGSSWGWGTWADRWKKVDWTVSDYHAFAANPGQQKLFARGGCDLPGMLKLQMDGKIDSWSIRFDYAHYKQGGFCLHPVKSRIHNIGFDGSGVHCGHSADYAVTLDEGLNAPQLRPDLQPDPALIEIVYRHFDPARRPALSLVSRAIQKAGRLARGGLTKAGLQYG